MIILSPDIAITDAIDAAKPSTLDSDISKVIHKRVIDCRFSCKHIATGTVNDNCQIARMLEFFRERVSGVTPSSPTR